MQADFPTYPVQERLRQPLIDFVVEGLAAAGCRVLHRPSARLAPFRFVIETPWAERIGVVMYLFRSTSVVTRNRPDDEARFQVKYGPDTKEEHFLFDDPYGLYTTIFAGIDLERGICVAADPRMHNPTRFFISVEYKNDYAEEAQRLGWTSWERAKRDRPEPIEVLVACAQERMLDLLLFERAAVGLAPGHRQLLAERLATKSPSMALVDRQSAADPFRHRLLAELDLDVELLLDVIENAERLKMAVRGWVAERKLIDGLRQVADVASAEPLAGDGRPDVAVELANGAQLIIECKNCLRKADASRRARVDFQRTRAAKSDPCSRYYMASDFDVLAACLHPVTEKWEFAFKLTSAMAPHRRCPGRLDDRVVVDDTWATTFEELIVTAGLAG
jgi:hypothetical protein